MTKPITQGYLKGYYGYKNFGDELLALGVIRYLFAHYPLEILYIEVDDIDRFWTWLRRHETLVGEFLCKVKLIAKSDKISVIRYSMAARNVHLFLGGGEVFAPARGWFHGGGNLYLLYRPSFIRHNVTLLGGVSIAKNRAFRLLYRLTLSFCDKIILREKHSYKYVIDNYALKDNTVLYRDFGHDIIDSLDLSTAQSKFDVSIPRPKCPYLIVNANPYVDMSMLTDMVSTLTRDKHIEEVVYFPGDGLDMILFKDMSTSIRHNKLTLFDWTKYDIYAIIDLFKHASYGLGVRLHVLSMFKRLGIPFDYIVYQEKIVKFLDLHDKKEGEASEMS